MTYLEIIIDGYNFLKTTGLMDTQVADIELEKGRKRLLQLLVKSFPDLEDREKIVVVFDSATILNLPNKLKVQGIQVRFSKGYDSADELIMELIRTSSVPKRLLVVSSDHEIQTSASRRKASFIDSELWLDELEKKLKRNDDLDSEPDGQQTEKLELGDSSYWLKVFSDVPDMDDSAMPFEEPFEDSIEDSTSDAETIDGFASEDNPSNAPPKDSNESEDNKARDLEELDGWDDIFPPGYGEDLIE